MYIFIIIISNNFEMFKYLCTVVYVSFFYTNTELNTGEINLPDLYTIKIITKSNENNKEIIMKSRKIKQMKTIWRFSVAVINFATRLLKFLSRYSRLCQSIFPFFFFFFFSFPFPIIRASKSRTYHNGDLRRSLRPL